MTEKQRQLTPADFMDEELSFRPTTFALGDRMEIIIGEATVVEIKPNQGQTVAWREDGKVFEMLLPFGVSVYRLTD